MCGKNFLTLSICKKYQNEKHLPNTINSTCFQYKSTFQVFRKKEEKSNSRALKVYFHKSLKEKRPYSFIVQCELLLLQILSNHSFLKKIKIVQLKS